MALRTQRRRRKENKTDYKLRKTLLESGIPRIVVRRTNRYFLIQAVESSEAKDKVLFSVSSKDLLSKGWDKKFEGSLKSLPAGYLTGLLFAQKVKDEKYILDLGMARTIQGNRVFAVAKGLKDGGVNVSVSEKVLPSEERVSGEHLKEGLKEMVSKVKSEIENGK